MLRSSIIALFLIIFSWGGWANPDPRPSLPLDVPKANKDYQEWSKPREMLPRHFRILSESMSYYLLSAKAFLAEYAHLKVPAYKRYKYAAYLNDEGDLIPLQYLDWTKGHPVLSDNPFHVYVSGTYHLFQLESYDKIKLYTYDGRFYRDPDGFLRSMAHKLLILNTDNQPIYLKTNRPVIDIKGRIFEDDEHMGTIKVVSFESSNGLWTLDGTVFYQREPKKVVILDTKDYELAQGFHESSNKHPGQSASALFKPMHEATAEATKKVIESYEVMFKAVYDN